MDLLVGGYIAQILGTGFILEEAGADDDGNEQGQGEQNHILEVVAEDALDEVNNQYDGDAGAGNRDKVQENTDESQDGKAHDIAFCCFFHGEAPLDQ